MHHTTKMYTWVKVSLHPFLTSTQDGGEFMASCPGYFTPRERAPATHWKGGLVGPRTGLDMMVKSKIPIMAPAGKWNPVILPIAVFILTYKLPQLLRNFRAQDNINIKIYQFN
jgi:hypothetical protein